MTFRMDKLTIKAQEAVQQAQSLMQEKGHPEIDPLHLLAALLEDSDGIVGPILQKIGANQSQIRSVWSALQLLLRPPPVPRRPGSARKYARPGSSRLVHPESGTNLVRCNHAAPGK